MTELLQGLGQQQAADAATLPVGRHGDELDARAVGVAQLLVEGLEQVIEPGQAVGAALLADRLADGLHAAGSWAAGR